MFSRLLAWFKRKPSGEPYDLYKPAERLIYTYWDGSKEVRTDPMVLYKRIMAVGPELSIDLKVSLSESKDASKAHDLLVKKVREIFNLVPMNGSVGLTELEALNLFDHFLVYCTMLKKNTNLFPMFSTSAPEPSKSTSGGESQPSPSTSDSGSTEAAPTTAEPPSSPSA